MQYEILENQIGLGIVKREDDNGIIVFIPQDPANSDYQEYLNKDKP